MPTRGKQSALWDTSHGAGKGDKDRTGNVEAFRENHAAIFGDRTPKGGKTVKSYGPPKPTTFATIRTRLVIH